MPSFWAVALLLSLCAAQEVRWSDPNIILNNGEWHRIPDPFFQPQDIRPYPPLHSYDAAAGEGTVIVLIAALRETRTVATIESIFARAAHPERVRVGVVQQNAAEDEDALEAVCAKRGTPLEVASPEQRKHVRLPGEDDYGHGRYTPASLAACDLAERIRVYRMDASEAKGPVFARAQQVRLLGAGLAQEDFCMQIDAHTIFTQDWDVHMVKEWSATENEYAVLTTYPTNFAEIPADGTLPNVNRHWEMPHLCKASLMGPGIVRNAQAGAAAGLTRPQLCKLWAAGLSFSRCHAETDVPADPNLKQIFTGEEFSRAARLWTNGYDFYSMARPVIGTYYGGEKGGKGSWRSIPAERRVAEKRLARLLRHEATLAQDAEGGMDVPAFLAGYDLGTRRRFEDYIALTGVDTVHHKYSHTHCMIHRYTPWEDGAQGPYEPLDVRPGKLPPLDVPPQVMEQLGFLQDEAAEAIAAEEDRDLPANMRGPEETAATAALRIPTKPSAMHHVAAEVAAAAAAGARSAAEAAHAAEAELEREGGGGLVTIGILGVCVLALAGFFMSQARQQNKQAKST